MQRLVLILTMGLVVLALYTFQRERQPDPNMVSLAVRATVYAMPSPSAQIVEVTREVEVTRMVEVVRYVEVTPTPTAIPTEVPTATHEPTATSVAVVPNTENLAVAAAAGIEERAPEMVAEEAQRSESGCPVSSSRTYSSIPVAGGGASHPPAQHGDLNLALRGYVAAEATAGLVDINGPTDGDAPQLPGVLGRAATIAQTLRAHDWNWGCGGAGCRGDVLSHVEVSMVGLASSPGEVVHVPSRGPEIYGGGYVAMVLYAEPTRLTVVYTREDSVANGYAVHLENICVDPNLLALYQANHAGGRGQLPAVRNGEVVGVAQGHQVLVGVRDRGTFTDPRSRKDWWRGH